MRKLKLIPILSILAISLFVSLSFVQSASARPHMGSSCRRRGFYYRVWMPTGEADSNVNWLECVYPIHWWGDPTRTMPPPIVEEYTIDDVYVCHGDWFVGCAVKEGNFRYRWWIFWESKEAAGEKGAKSLGGYFIFSHGTGDFEDMWTFGKAWVKMLPGEYFPVGYQYHVGLMFGGP